MVITKTIYQTFKTDKLPLITRWHVRRLRKRNPDYDYQFFTDEAIEKFLENEYDSEIVKLYRRINLGAAKADFFRYAILYKRGGVYLDIDSLIKIPLTQLVKPTDSALIAFEKQHECYVQYALFYEKEHPFMTRALEVVIDNLKTNRYPNDVHLMTGPTAYTQAIKDCIKNDENLAYRQWGGDYDSMVQFSYSMR